MKFLLPVIAYLAMGFILGYGVLLASRGSFTFLVIGALAYVVAVGKLGCLPGKSAH